MTNCAEPSPDLTKLAIMIPAYNAAKTIEAVFERVPREVHRMTSRILVLNDGSTDDTGLVLQRIQRRFCNVDVIEHETNRGYGAAEKTLLEHALTTDADVFVLLHADGAVHSS